MVLLVALLYHVLPPVPAMDLVNRLAYALNLNVVAIIPLFIMFIAVGNGRFLSEAIDPTRHVESREMEINAKVANNTLEQGFVFFVGTLALSTRLAPESMTLIPALAIVFILARIVFWIGYRKNPLYRAPGMAATSYMNLGILLTALYLFFF